MRIIRCIIIKDGEMQDTAKGGEPGRSRPRQKEVAALAGVSQASVSTVINQRPHGNVRISAETERRVWDAVRQLGYAPDPVARSLAGGQNRLLGVFTYEAAFPSHPQITFYPFLVGIEQEAEAQDYNLLLFTRASGPDGRRAIYQDGGNGLRLADGAILLGKRERLDEMSRLQREGFPFVFIGRRQIPDGQLSYVVAAHAESTAEMVGRIIDAGHHRLAYLRSPRETEAGEDREAGYRLAHRRRRMPVDEHLIHQIDQDNISAALLWRQLAADVTAFVVDDTDMARKVLALGQAMGKAIPRDFSLAALGDSMTDPAIDPDITTLVVPRREIGARAVRLLIDRLSHPGDAEPCQIALPCTIAPGRTLAAPPTL
jgi:DNA-binding LacI/PurR family transcriptional regulator